jgi:hypothetical protein
MCAFKQNLFIPPLVQDIWMCIQAKPSHPSPCSRHLDVHSSKTFSSLPLFKTFACAFKQKPYLPSPQNLRANTEGLGWVFIPMSLRFACPFKWQVVSSHRTFARLRLGFMFPWSWDFGCAFWVKKVPSICTLGRLLGLECDY